MRKLLAGKIERRQTADRLITTKYVIRTAKEHDWREIADMIARSIPNALVSSLGTRFGAAFYSRIASMESSCAYVALDDSDSLAGVIIGTADSRCGFLRVFQGQWFRLVLAANFRLLRCRVIVWLLRGIIAKARGKKEADESDLAAEMMAIAVRQHAQGSGVAQELVATMQEFMISKHSIDKLKRSISNEQPLVRVRFFIGIIAL